jgi:hypothetical protein
MSLLTDLASVDFQRHDRIDPAGAPGGGNDASSATATSTAATVA